MTSGAWGYAGQEQRGGHTVCTLVTKCEVDNEKCGGSHSRFVGVTRKLLRTERSPLGPTTVYRSHIISQKARRVSGRQLPLLCLPLPL